MLSSHSTRRVQCSADANEWIGRGRQGRARAPRTSARGTDRSWPGGRSSRPLRPASSRHAEDNPTAVGIGDVVEAKKLPRTPTNQRASVLVGHGLDLDVARLESRGNAEESVAGFLGLEVSGGPRNEFGQWDVLWGFADVHGDALSGGDTNSGYHIPERGADRRCGSHLASSQEALDLTGAAA